MAEEEVQYSYEYWDCACGKKELRGDIEICPGCGHPRDAETKFYRQADKTESITDKKQLERFEAGADWVCSFCQELNSNLLQECRACGHQRFKTDEDYFQNQQKKDHEHQQSAETAPATGKSQHLVGVVVALLLAGIIGWWWCTRTQAIDYVVAAVHWQRSIPVERYDWTQLEDWQNEIHGDGVVKLSTHNQVRRYERRLVGTRLEHYTESEQYQSGTRDETSSSYESLGNGAGKTVITHKTVPVYSTRELDRTRTVPIYSDFPIYDTKVQYRAKMYRGVRTLSSHGHDNHPAWPPAKLATGVDQKPDREGARSESYNISMSKSNAREKGPLTYSFKTSEDQFTHKYLLGKHIHYLVNNMGNITAEAD